jgi:hypothetical protein
VKIKTRQQILTDLIKESRQHPKGWKATFGRDPRILSNDCYIFNPEIGIYLIKEYQKNPYQTKGIGSKIARNIDTDIEEKISQQSGDFGIIQGNIQRFIENVNKGIHPSTIFKEGLKGNDLGIKIPLKGKASVSKDAFHYLHDACTQKQKKLNKECENMMAKDGVYSSYD